MTAKTDELTSGSICILPLVFLDFDGDPTYLWGGVGDLSYDSQTWTGVGDLGDIGSISSDAKGGAKSLTLRLNGLKELDGSDTDGLAALKSISYQGQSAYVYAAFFEDDGKTLVSGVTPDLIYAGRISHMSASKSQEDASISCTIDSFLSLLSRPIPLLMTDDEHQRYQSGDKGYDHKSDSISKDIFWGLDGNNRIGDAPPVNYRPWLSGARYL